MHEAVDCIRNLTKNEFACILLRQADVIVCEELGVISAQLYFIPDTAIKYLMNNEMKMGGKLVILNGDPFQLQAIKGNSMLLPTHFLFGCDVALPEHHVRFRSDPNLQILVTVLSNTEFTEQDIRKADKIIKENCNSIDGWDQAPANAIKVVPKRRAAVQIANDYLRNRAQNTTERTIEAHSKDQCQIGDIWEPLGNVGRVKMLDKILNEPKVLTLYEGAVASFTHNTAFYSQGQLLAVHNIPNLFVNLVGKTTVAVAPPGVKDASTADESWSIVEIKSRASVPVIIGNNCLQGRRIQCPIAHKLSQTIHKFSRTNIASCC